MNLILADSYPLCKPEDRATLHEECLNTLLSLLEGVRSPYIPRMMLITLDFKIMVMALLWSLYFKLTFYRERTWTRYLPKYPRKRRAKMCTEDSFTTS